MMDKSALYKLTYGLYVVGVKTEIGYGGSIVDAVAQVSAGEPPMIILSSMKRNLTNERIHAEGSFTLSVLPGDVDPFVVANFGFQSARDVDKWANVPHTMKDGLPVLDGAAAYLRCKVVDLREFDTHTMFITETADAWIGLAESAPLVYADYLRDMKDAAFAAFQKF
jgi:flavin reductase (DIM6/NTAB) family NADH-FMN oxidoreductase RutF